MRNASLSQSVPGKHRARESVSTGKEVSDDRRLLILKILKILEILIQTTESVGGHTSLLTTAGGALAKRAYTNRARGGKVGDVGKPASRWYRRDGPRATVKSAVLKRAYRGD